MAGSNQHCSAERPLNPAINVFDSSGRNVYQSLFRGAAAGSSSTQIPLSPGQYTKEWKVLVTPETAGLMEAQVEAYIRKNSPIAPALASRIRHRHSRVHHDLDRLRLERLASGDERDAVCARHNLWAGTSAASAAATGESTRELR